MDRKKSEVFPDNNFVENVEPRNNKPGDVSFNRHLQSMHASNEMNPSVSTVNHNVYSTSHINAHNYASVNAHQQSISESAKKEPIDHVKEVRNILNTKSQETPHQITQRLTAIKKEFKDFVGLYQ